METQSLYVTRIHRVSSYMSPKWSQKLFQTLFLYVFVFSADDGRLIQSQEPAEKNSLPTHYNIVYNEASLIRTPLIQIIHLSGHMFGNQLLFLHWKWLTHPDIQLSGQLVWEWGFPDKWGSTVVRKKRKKFYVGSSDTITNWSEYTHLWICINLCIFCAGVHTDCLNLVISNWLWLLCQMY